MLYHSSNFISCANVSNAANARLLALVKQGETLARDWPNTNERREMVTSTVTLLNTIYRRNTKRLRLCDMYYVFYNITAWLTDDQLHHDVIDQSCQSPEPDITINWRDRAHFDSEDDYRTGCRNVIHCQQQQSYSGLRSNSTYFWNDSWVQTFQSCT